MTKKELIKAIKSCKEVEAIIHIHEHFCIQVKVVKADLIWTLNFETEKLDKNEVYHAQMVNDVLLIG
jgi:hypothetical protein